MGDAPGGLGVAPEAGPAEAIADVDAAADVLAAVQDTLRSAMPQEWVSVASDGYTGRVIDLLGRSQQLGWCVADARDAVTVVAREIAATRAGLGGGG